MQLTLQECLHLSEFWRQLKAELSCMREEMAIEEAGRESAVRCYGESETRNDEPLPWVKEFWAKVKADNEAVVPVVIKRPVVYPIPRQPVKRKAPDYYQGYGELFADDIVFAIRQELGHEVNLDFLDPPLMDFEEEHWS